MNVTARNERIAELDAEVVPAPRPPGSTPPMTGAAPPASTLCSTTSSATTSPSRMCPRVRIDPIPGHVRHMVLLLAHAITRVTLEQADLQMRLDAQEEEATGAGQ